MRRGLMIAGMIVIMLAWWTGPASAATRWVIQQPGPVKGGSALFGVSCVSPANCTAAGAGGGRTLAEHWDGSTWAIQATPNPSGSFRLVSVSCVSAASCTAIGWLTNSATGDLNSFAEFWDGSTWTIQAMPGPVGALVIQLASVSCASATSCTAAGWFSRRTTTADHDLPLAEHWDGSRWRIQPTPLPAGSAAAAFSGVWCRSPANCTAVGSAAASATSPNSLTLAEHWDGSTWTVQPTPSAAGAIQNGLAGVSCVSPTSCTAVGSYRPGSGQPFSLPLAEHWDGSSWTIQPTPSPAGADEIGLSGVSCVSLTSCTAVGSSTQGPLAEYWNGSTWAIQHTPVPVGSTAQSLAAVSCTLRTTCTAVGQYFRNNYHGLIEAK